MRKLLGKKLTAVSHNHGCIKLGFLDGTVCTISIKSQVGASRVRKDPRLLYFITTQNFDHVLGESDEES